MNDINFDNNLRIEIGLTKYSRERVVDSFSINIWRFRRPENNVLWLAPSNIFFRKRGVHLFGVCVFNWRNMVCKEWLSDTHHILTLFQEKSLSISEDISAVDDKR